MAGPVGRNEQPYAFNSILNRGLNAAESTATYLLKKSGAVVAPAALGAIGGWGIGVGRHVGLLQGLTSGLYHVLVINPGETYIKRNKGTGPYDLHENAADFLRIVGIISGIAIPIILTGLCAEAIDTAASTYLAKDGIVKWLLVSPTSSYSWLKGLGVNLFPIAAQYWISSWRQVDKEFKRA